MKEMARFSVQDTQTPNLFNKPKLFLDKRSTGKSTSFVFSLVQSNRNMLKNIVIRKSTLMPTIAFYI
ncbi:hypothetical protein BKI52_16450 [marine bacterium AO1-C]|nr:hypothetical protein BKI52_16450 [marine bacterium AO1-C]